jgi:energy-coupling factor transporter transmembrane protein EcfT
MNIFHYRDIDTSIHRLSPITKIIITLLISSLILKSSIFFTSLICISLFILLLIVKVPLKNYAKEGIYFFFLLLIISVSHYLSTENIVSTIQITLAFCSMIMMSVILLDTTAFNDIASTIGYFLSLFSSKLGYRIATTIELTLHMIPLFFDAASDLRLARKARGQRINRHIISQVVEYVSALFSITFIKVERLELALKARMFNPDNKREYMKIRRKDLLILLIASVSIIILYLTI